MAKVLTSLYPAHLAAGLFFARAADGLEQRGASATLTEHRAYVVGAVLSSVSFLEARFNEFVANPFVRGSGFPPRSARRLAQALKSGRMDRLPILEKYQMAIFLAGKEPLPEGREPYQPADLLIALRNALVHFRPEWSRPLDLPSGLLFL